jgi:hypothetical protein
LIWLTFLFNEAIWLKWWADVGGGQLPLYITVYILLGIFNSVGNGGYAW